MNQKLNWGILGTGSIARKFALGLRESRTGRLAGVGSRTEETARKFAVDFPARIHGSYESLLADPEVEAVYVSTPHPMHAEWTVKAAEAGKHVLCEKPLAMDFAEALAMVEAARRNDVFLMEAFMYRCQPQTAKLVELIRAGTIGELRLIRSSSSFLAPFNPDSRLFNPALGGGGILDVGCYPASMVRLIAGTATGRGFAEPLFLKGCVQTCSRSGVDEFAIASLDFGGGLFGQIACGLNVSLENNVQIWGTKGNIVVPSPWFGPGTAGFSKIIIFKQGMPDEVVVEADRGIYAIEADHVAEHLDARQSPAMPWDDSLGNMKALDAWRAG